MIKNNIGSSSKGRTRDFESLYLGSNPREPAILKFRECREVYINAAIRGFESHY